MTTTEQFVIYNGNHVAIEEVYFDDVHGQIAIISFDDGNEEQVPLATLDIIA